MKPPPKSSKASQAQSQQYETDSESIHEELRQAESAPVMDRRAYYGPIGDIALKAGNVTEADSRGILLCGLVAFGNAVGRTAFFSVANSKQYANENVVLVGATAIARKGMAIDISEGILYTADPEWAINRIAYGFNSGEGVVHKIRDPRTKIKLDKSGKEEEKIVDPGVEDKRCLCVSTEFGELLTVMNREGCTLTMVIRNAWDNRKKIEINTRANPICVTEPHISVVGAITHDELEQLLPKIPNANGFSNRFLWAMVERTQSLPEGGPPVEDYAAKELNAVREAMIKARSIRGMERSSEARKRWKEIYDNLGTGAGHAMVDRGQPHVLRLSMLFALAEGSSIISLAHLEAAGALWNYCKDCALRLFRTYRRPVNSQKILDHLEEKGSQGATKTDISVKVFNRNRTSIEIATALINLKNEGVVRMEKERDDHNHRVERWFAIAK